MPAVSFTIRWPDGVEQVCTSPSTIVHDHLPVGLALPVGRFVERSGSALAAAGERVRERYGFECTAARAEQAAIEAAAARYPDDRTVRVVAVDGVRARAS